MVTISSAVGYAIVQEHRQFHVVGPLPQYLPYPVVLREIVLTIRSFSLPLSEVDTLLQPVKMPMVSARERRMEIDFFMG